MKRSCNCFLTSLLFCNFITASVSCAVDGNIRLRPKDGQVMDTSNYHLLQVCLFGQWNYVCDIIDFSRFDLSVTLHQLGYTGGDSRSHNGGELPALITDVACIGVERRLIDCPINISLDNYMCNPVEISVNNDNQRLCKNGELSQMHVTLNICVDGNWRTLCPSLWGPSQAIVACRQLNPGRTVIGVAEPFSITFSTHFKYPFFCNGSEKHITDCIIHYLAANDKLCNDTMATFLMCQTGPAQLTLRAVSSDSVEVNWTQPVSVPRPQYRVSNYNITCTSSHDVHSNTSQHVTTLAVDESTHIHMIISGLTANTSYTCCVSAHSELGTSESVCDTIITTDKGSNTTSNTLMTSSAVVQSCTVDVRATPCTFQDLDSQIPTAASWVGGVIIGAVLSTVILLTVLAAVCLWRRKRTHSQHNTSVVSEGERTASSSHTNDIYNAAYSLTSPQPYEECQPIRSTEPEYSYATPHTTSTLQQSNSNVMGLAVVDNTVLYSMCEEGVQEKKEYKYSEINRK